jgi:hypothetical protein
MIGRPLGRSSPQPPKWMVIDPSSLGVAVMLMLFAWLSFGSKYPSALYSEIDQNASTGRLAR